MDNFESQVRGLISELQDVGAVLSCDGIRLIVRKDPQVVELVKKNPVADFVSFFHQRTGSPCLAVSFKRTI